MTAVAALTLAAIANWDWTAIGTILLALATFALAWQNRSLVRASQDELAEVRKDVTAAQEQAQTARRALAAQTQPLLSAVPRGMPRYRHDEFRHDEFRREVVGADAADVDATFDPDRGGVITVPFRNIGNAVAVINAVMFWMHDGGSEANAEETALPPGEITRARLELPSTSRFGDEVVLAKTNLSVVVTYGDAAGEPRGATRLDVYYSDSRHRWYVRQIHFGDDDESVRERPRASSAPTG